ncbi:MAG: hypothetical protein HKN39_04425 [Flavobacteriales bacterium]|nr:hypothetical protein [Flavobacteriales bacterium]
MKLANISIVIGLLYAFWLVYVNIDLYNTIKPIIDADKDALNGNVIAGGYKTVMLGFFIPMIGLAMGIMSAHKGVKHGVVGILLNILGLGSSFMPAYLFFI